MKRNLKSNVRGIQIGSFAYGAEKKLATYDNGSTLLRSALNGSELYIKEGGKVRISTMDEWQKYWGN